jgi:hypothetical protein
MSGRDKRSLYKVCKWFDEIFFKGRRHMLIVLEKVFEVNDPKSEASCVEHTCEKE